MTTYTAIANTEVDPESPVTSDLMTKLRDNPLAQGEGTTGAPRVLGRALDVVEDTNSGSQGVSTTTVTASDITLADIDWVLLAGWVQVRQSGGDVGQVTVDYQTTTNAGSTWSGATNILVQKTEAGTNQRFGISAILDISGSFDGIRIRVTTDGNSASQWNVGIISLGGS
ncbi:MAG: hypothetical protein MJH10_10060 [Epibacterium sp.]|nr:hypothetical protein [Epibacterium sp.]NQX73881.1 hypothetical protein [Epibacterium sp.]